MHFQSISSNYCIQEGSKTQNLWRSQSALLARCRRTRRPRRSCSRAAPWSSPTAGCAVTPDSGNPDLLGTSQSQIFVLTTFEKVRAGESNSPAVSQQFSVYVRLFERVRSDLVVRDGVITNVCLIFSLREEASPLQVSTSSTRWTTARARSCTRSWSSRRSAEPCLLSAARVLEFCSFVARKFFLAQRSLGSKRP